MSIDSLLGTRYCLLRAAQADACRVRVCTEKIITATAHECDRNNDPIEVSRYAACGGLDPPDGISCFSHHLPPLDSQDKRVSDKANAVAINMYIHE